MITRKDSNFVEEEKVVWRRFDS